MADFRGVEGSGKSYTVASLKMTIGGDTLKLRSVSPGGREVTQEHVFTVGSRVPVAIVTGPVKPREVTTVFDPLSFSTWNRSRKGLATQRITITAVLMETGLPTITLAYEQCGTMGDEYPELKAGEATEFNATMKWLPTRMTVDGQDLVEN